MKQSRLVNHSNEVIHSLDNIVGFVTQSESAVRGYIITDHKELLTKYNSSRDKTDSTFNVIESYATGNPQQLKNLDSLHILIADKFSWLDRALAIFDSTHRITYGLTDSRDKGIAKMANVESYAQHIQNVERESWIQGNSKLAKYSNVIKIFTIISLIVAVLLTFYSIVTFNKENKAKLEADGKAKAYQEQLEMRVNELAALNVELVELRNIEKFAVTGRISRTIAHEVRNPLTNINLATEQLKNEVPENEDVNLLFEMISRNSNRINQLISDLLNSTRTSELTYVKASINDVIDMSLEFANDRIELKEIQVIKNYEKDVCPILVDQEKIIIALLNIIVNSVEAMEEKGVLHLSTESKSDRCVVKIADTGKGLTKDDLTRLFEPYFTTKEKGTGLGLTNTQNIILAHNGNINVESEPGRGTTFIITFNFEDKAAKKT